MVEECGDYWKNGEASKNMAKKREKEMIRVVLRNGVSDQSAP